LHTPDFLDKGSLVHYMLAKYYRGKMDKRSTTDLLPEIVTAGRRWYIDKDLPIEIAEECIRQVKEYILFTISDSWIPVAVEEPFSRVLFERSDEPCKSNNHGDWQKTCPDCQKTEGLRILLEGRVDLIVRLLGNEQVIMIVDHKTGSRNQEPSVLSNQFMGYAWAFKDVFATATPRVVINKIGFQKTLAPKERFRRYVRSFTTPRLEEWREETIYWIHQIVKAVDANYYVKNLTGCDKYSGCIFRDVCAADPSARQYKLQTQFKIRDSHDPFSEDEE
jgi:hypothetical protein